jgi:hypothetical protein
MFKYLSILSLIYDRYGVATLNIEDINYLFILVMKLLTLLFLSHSVISTIISNQIVTVEKEIKPRLLSDK